MFNGYVPEVGHSVRLVRKVTHRWYFNDIVGAVVDTWSNAIRVRVHSNGQSEDLRFFPSDWDCTFSHFTQESEYEVWDGRRE